MRLGKLLSTGEVVDEVAETVTDDQPRPDPREAVEPEPTVTARSSAD